MSKRQRRMTFFFDAASCSGCKACQVACKDRHDLEVGRLWRRVSEVAGGSWERPETAILRGIDGRMDDLVKLLGARSFFYADALSMADLAVYGMLYTIGLGAIPGAAPLVTARPTLLELMRRVEERTGGRQADAQ